MLNQVNLVGRIAKATVLTSTPDGTAVVGFVVATNGWKDKPAQFHVIRVFGNQADSCHKHLAVGQQVVVVGRLEYSKWTDDRYHDSEGSPLRRVQTVVVANNVQFGSKKRSARPTGNDLSPAALTNMAAAQDSSRPVEDDDRPF